MDIEFIQVLSTIFRVAAVARVNFDKNEYVRFRLAGIRIPWTGGQAELEPHPLKDAEKDRLLAIETWGLDIGLRLVSSDRLGLSWDYGM